MKKLPLIVSLLSIVSGTLYAQDSLRREKTDSVKQALEVKRHTVDSTTTALFTKLDSTENARIEAVTSSVDRVNAQLDSLGTLSLPTGKYNHQADSLYRGLSEKIAALKGGRSDSLSAAYLAKMQNVQASVHKRLTILDSLKQNNSVSFAGVGDKLKLPQNDLPDIPATSLPGVPGLPVSRGSASLHTPNVVLPQSNGVQMPNTLPPANQGINRPVIDLPATNVQNDVASITGKVEKVGEVSDHISEKSAQARELKDKKPEISDKEIEKQALEIDEVSEIKNGLPDKDKLVSNNPEMPGMPNVAEGIGKEKLVNQSKNKLRGFFVGKEALVENDIVKMSRYQKKFPSLPDTRLATKKAPNLMADKPFIERIIPGLNFEIHNLTGNWKGIDISPNFEYWLSDKIRAGFGFTYQPWVEVKQVEIKTKTSIYAVRSVLNVKLLGTCFLSLQPELRFGMPQVSKGAPANATSSARVWSRHFHTGLFKTYYISKRTDGTMLILYDAANIGKTFNVSQIGIRVGVEYKLHKSRK